MNRQVTISGERLSLVLTLPERGMPEIVAFRPHSATTPYRHIEPASRLNGMDLATAPAVLLPTAGMGFFGWPAICGHRGGRHFLQQFAGWSSQQAGMHTTLCAAEPESELSLEVEMTLVTGGMLRMTTAVTNTGATPFTLDRCMAGTMLIDLADAEISTFTGAWGREFQQRDERLGSAIWIKENRRGRTSHDRFPAIVARAGGKSSSGEVCGLHLAWSGNHVMAIDPLEDGRFLAHAGELFEPGEIILAAGETYRSPSLYVSCQRNHPDLVEAFHAAARDVVPPYRGRAMKARLVTLNTWEGNYFTHDLESLKAQATAAAELGIERYVLDDGWFGRRGDDSSSLGDWIVDKRKYPDGLEPLIEHVKSLGMEFGIWFEPEMVNPDSDLYRAHPDWILRVADKPLLLSRRQLVLDLTREEVCNYLFWRMSELLSGNRVDCIKWDMNRDLTHSGDARGRAAASRQTLAVYALMDRIRDSFPEVEIESCASGGGRADYGILKRAQRIWTSDCTDASERLEIQRGARVFLPPEILGAHVSASPNHQTGRRHSLAFRAIVALAYHFGVELNLLSLAPDERAELKAWIALHKRLRPVLHAPGGQFHCDPVDGRYAWGVGRSDTLILLVAQGPQIVREPLPLRLPSRVVGRGAWRIARHYPVQADFVQASADQQRLLSGDIQLSALQLAETGLPLPALRPESGIVLELERVEGA